VDSVIECCVAPCFSKLTSLQIFFEENPLVIVASNFHGAKFLRGNVEKNACKKNFENSKGRLLNVGLKVARDQL
jgi:hypothetical protein